MEQAFIGVDVGTASARAGIFDAHGSLLTTARHPIRIWHEAGDIVEQSSADIWNACVEAIRSALSQAALPATAIKGIGFDATCSLVVLDRAARPLAVGPSDDAQRDVIVWMDHRATAEARFINETQDDVLNYVGKIISPEMQMPKLLWLKRHRPATYEAAGHFLDLSDFLTFHATGATTRSSCTVTCKWTYLAHYKRWSAPFFARIGLDDLARDDGRARIGSTIVAPGTPIGQGLCAEAAREFGLIEGTPVGASLIDAHAGGVGTVGACAENREPVDVTERLAYVMGTSACIMATTKEPCFVPGVWGPYFSAMVPGFWLNEGGQSAAGVGLDHLVRAHPATPQALAAAKEEGVDILSFLEKRILTRYPNPGDAAVLARALHVLPEFLGNRSPHADPDMRAVVAGLGLDEDISSLERLFVASLCGLAYGLADVVEAMRNHGVACRTMVISGGASRSALVRQIMADATGLEVVRPGTPEPVLLGAAMLGAVASGAQPSIPAAMEGMSTLGASTLETPPSLQDFHRAKRTVHGRMRTLDVESRAIMLAAP